MRVKGWLRGFYMKIIKMPAVLRFQMRNREKKIVHALPHMRLFVYSKINVEVEELHEASRALRDQKKPVKDATKAEHAEFDLAFFAQIEQVLQRKEVIGIEGAVLKHEQQYGPLGYEVGFGKNTLTSFGIDNNEQRRAYFTFLEPIIKVAEHTGEYEALMEEIKTMGPAQTNLAAAIALRIEIRVSSSEIPKLRQDKKQVVLALRRWDTAKGDKRKQVAYLRQIIAKTENDIAAALHAGILILKRDFLLALLTLKYMADDEKMMWRYYKEEVMPKLQEEERIKSLEELKQRFASDFQVLAQGMRRIMAMERRAERMAKQIIEVAQARPRAA